MNGDNNVLIVSLIGVMIISLILLVVLIFYLIKDYIEFLYIKKTSKLYIELSEINNYYIHNNYESKFIKTLYFNKSCNSKREYDTFSCNDYVLILLGNNNNLVNVLNHITSINEEYLTYNIHSNKVINSYSTYYPENCKYSYDYYKKLEKKHLNKIILKKPDIKLKCYIHVSYISPKGRNKYFKTYSYDYYNLIELYNYFLESQTIKNSYQYHVKHERSKMSVSLRYDVLTRDNYRCVICGASAQEGAKLHVDHIIPVSKGGMTEMSNLQTLCDRCNLGKSNKI